MLSVLELTDVDDYTLVTPENPLRVFSPIAMNEGEHMLPVGFDGEAFLPLGRSVVSSSGGTALILGRLAAPDPERHPLPGRLDPDLFQKVASEVLGRAFESEDIVGNTSLVPLVLKVDASGPRRCAPNGDNPTLADKRFGVEAGEAG